MKSFPILSIFIGLILLLPVDSFAQNKGAIDGNSTKATVTVINAPDDHILAATSAPAPCQIPDPSVVYTVGIDDILDINVLTPEAIDQTVTVAPDGSITFPYIGNVLVKGHTIAQVQDEIQRRLADGYIKYPVVSVSLKESHSLNFFVYGEVEKPGSYPIEDNMTVLRAISMAGGFTRFGSSSNVKVLRVKKTGVGYESITVNIKGVMNGDSTEDVSLKQGDIVTVSEGVF